MGERHHLEELAQQRGVVYVAFHNEHPTPLQKRLPSPLQRRVVVVIEAVQTKDPITAAFERRRHVGPDEASSTGDEDGDSVAGPDFGGGPDPFFPGGSAPIVGSERAAGGIGRQRIRGRGVEEEDQDQAEENKGPECELGERAVQAEAVNVGRLVHLELAGRWRTDVEVGHLLELGHLQWRM